MADVSFQISASGRLRTHIMCLDGMSLLACRVFEEAAGHVERLANGHEPVPVHAVDLGALVGCGVLDVLHAAVQ